MWGGHPLIAVVPTFKRPEMLARCVASLRGHVDDVIVVDGVSPVFKARNRGIEQAPSNAIILSVDDDCHYDESLRLERSLWFLSAPIGVIQIGHKPSGAAFATYREHLDRNPPEVWPMIYGWMAGGFLFRRSVWREVGGYPDEYLDDLAFSASVYRAGYLNLHSTYSYGYHDHDSATGGLAEADVYSPSDLSRWGLGGEPWVARGGVQTVRASVVSPSLIEEHRRRHHERFEAVNGELLPRQPLQRLRDRRTRRRQ